VSFLSTLPTLKGCAKESTRFVTSPSQISNPHACFVWSTQELVRKLGEWSPIPCTYAGGANSVRDLARVHELSGGQVDLTFGSALDIFGGATVRCCGASPRRNFLSI
jgi:hypothetical protein